MKANTILSKKALPASNPLISKQQYFHPTSFAFVQFHIEDAISKGYFTLFT
jgi:hypothetical protein